MVSFPVFVAKLYLVVVCDAAVHTQPFKTWASLSDVMKLRLRIVTRQQALTHLPYGSGAVQFTFVRQPPDLQKDINF